MEAPVDDKALLARVAELEAALVRVTRERDDALSALAKGRAYGPAASSYVGVRRNGNGFDARIYENGKQLSIGTFKSEVEAAKAFDARARQIGRLQNLNFPTADEATAAAPRPSASVASEARAAPAAPPAAARAAPAAPAPTSPPDATNKRSQPASPTSSGLRQKKQPRRMTYAPHAQPAPVPAPAPVDTAEGPARGTRFLDDGRMWIVFKREGRRMVTNVSGHKKLRRVYKELDVVYYYAADAGTPPDESNYLDQCEYSGISEVREWIAKTPGREAALAARKSRPAAAAAAAPLSRDAAVAAAAAARPRTTAHSAPPPVPAWPTIARPRHEGPLVGLAVRSDVAANPCRGKIESCSASGICKVAWDDGSCSDYLEDRARHLVVASS